MNPAMLTLLIKSLDLLVLGINMSSHIRAAFMTITASVQVMINEGRDPTVEEWTNLDYLRDMLHETIQRAKPGDSIAHINQLRAIEAAHMVVGIPDGFEHD